MKACTNTIFCFCLAVVAAAAEAHHSRSEYDLPNPTEISGTVTSVSWRNPHIEISMTTDTGEKWILESSSAAVMNTAGLQKDILQAGMRVGAAGGASLRRGNRMLVSNILLPGNVELIMLINSPRRWQAEQTIGVGINSQIGTLSGGLPDDGRGLFRVWTFIPGPAGFWMVQPADRYPLTEKARLAAASWDVYDPAVNHVLRCIPPGMPATMGSPHPMEFVELADAIELHNEEFDIVRTIHMKTTSKPGDMPLSPLGYSQGRWDGDTLVVNTSRVDTPYLNRAGVPLSQAAEIEERFTVDAPNGRLEYLLTVNDPENLTAPFIQQLTWFWNENARLQRYDCDTSE